jgi:hypothetical protein
MMWSTADDVDKRIDCLVNYVRCVSTSIADDVDKRIDCTANYVRYVSEYEYSG